MIEFLFLTATDPRKCSLLIDTIKKRKTIIKANITSKSLLVDYYCHVESMARGANNRQQAFVAIKKLFTEQQNDKTRSRDASTGKNYIPNWKTALDFYDKVRTNRRGFCYVVKNSIGGS
jgi:hypothetical protein